MWPIILPLSQACTAWVARRFHFGALVACLGLEVFWRLLALVYASPLIALLYGISINVARTAVLLELAKVFGVSFRRELLGLFLAGSAFIASAGDTGLAKAMMLRQYYQVLLFALAVAIVFGTRQRDYRAYGLASVGWFGVIAVTGFGYRLFPGYAHAVNHGSYVLLIVATVSMGLALRLTPARKAAVLALWKPRPMKTEVRAA
jgi:hypothetical protein